MVSDKVIKESRNPYNPKILFICFILTLNI